MISFDNFQRLDPESADLARELIDATERERSAFSSFVSVWMGFNGWMECVSEADSDAEMIRELAGHKRVVDAYDMLLDGDTDFKACVGALENLLPVLNVRDVRRKLGRDAFLRLSREQLVREVGKQNVKYQPTDWVPGAPLTWPQLLKTIYAVRCNLFHGSKSPQNYRDHHLVVTCDRILRTFIERTACLGWND